MAHADFVHLRVHTTYSLSEGALKIDELIGLAVADAMPAVAITDTGNLFGALEFAAACAKAGVQPIIGCQIGVRREEGAPPGGGGVAPPPDTLVLLVRNEAGYHNLLHLVSRSFLDSEPGEPPQVSLADLEAANDGLIALSGGVAGAVGRLLVAGQDKAAREALSRLASLFPGRFYIEIMRHGTTDERAIEAALIDLADANDLPLLATNEAFFAEESLFEAHDALLCIAGGHFVDEDERRRLTPEHSFKPAAEMRALFADLPEAVDNTLVVARRCAFFPEPREPILPAFSSAAGKTEVDQLRAQARDGLKARLERLAETVDPAPYHERLEHELGIIEGMDYPGYFLIVAEFIDWAKQAGIPVGPGRGSGVGSVVAWALGITDLDPLRWGLLFERFLNPERVSMPDFDIDFCQDRRDEVIHHVQETYGADKVAQIITFGTLQARAALRDVGRVLRMPYGQVDRICKLVPHNPAAPVGLRQAIDGEPQLREMRAGDPAVARLLDIALKLEGLHRHASTHAAGVVIGDRPLEELVPLYRDPRSPMPVTQFSMKFVERAGLVKFDFLGLKTLTVLRRAREHLAKRGVEIDLSALPLDDRATFEMLGRGETAGVFQLESIGMRDVLRKLKPDRFEEIIAVVALFRPGPMENIASYIDRKHGDEQPDYLYPTLEPILQETYGTIIYQEQVMQIAQELSGYTLGSADLLRRAMGKKDKSGMEAMRKSFVEGAVERGVDQVKAAGIFDLVDKFAGYGFNKSHAAAYAMIAYQTAYLKANHPVEFLAAAMTLDLGNTEKLNFFRRELDRIGVRLLPPDINASGAVFTVETTAEGEPAIRYALAALKNVGRAAMEALVGERGAGGPYTSLADLARRLDTTVINRRQLESLAAAGAFDGLEPNRRRVFDAVELLLRFASAEAEERETGQSNLFGEPDEKNAPGLTLPEVADWPGPDRLRHEFEAVGFYLSAHPLDAYRENLARLEVTPAAELAALARLGGAANVKLAGTVTSRRERTASRGRHRGNRFAFVQMSDGSGVFELTVFSEVLAAARELLDQSLDKGKPLFVTAEARMEGEGLRLTAQTIRLLDEVTAEHAAGLRVFVSREAAVEGLKELIVGGRRGRARMTIVVDLDDREVEIALPGFYHISPQIRAAIKAVPGVDHVQEM